jgi:formamidopyrimidine-DNA glycosylase
VAPLPELPEVETVRRQLEEHLVGAQILQARCLVPKMLKAPVTDTGEFAEMVANATIFGVDRRGKYLILHMSNGYALVAHLKMRGQMRVLPDGIEDNIKYLCFDFQLTGKRRWQFRDVWAWGELRVVPDNEELFATYVPALASMGPEPLSKAFTPSILRDRAVRRLKSLIKTILLDQSILAGVGNIYADEVLYDARISPLRPVGTLESAEWGVLTEKIQSVLTEATACGGTVSDNFVDVDGNAGRYVPRVYGRSKLPCLLCGGDLRRTVVTGRGTVYCPNCQS